MSRVCQHIVKHLRLEAESTFDARLLVDSQKLRLSYLLRSLILLLWTILFVVYQKWSSTWPKQRVRLTIRPTEHAKLSGSEMMLLISAKFSLFGGKLLSRPLLLATNAGAPELEVCDFICFCQRSAVLLTALWEIPYSSSRWLEKLSGFKSFIYMFILLNYIHLVPGEYHSVTTAGGVMLATGRLPYL